MEDAQEQKPETDMEYELRMLEELNVWMAQRSVGLIVSIQKVAVPTPNGQTFFADAPVVELKKKKPQIIVPDSSAKVNDALKNMNGGRFKAL